MAPGNLQKKITDVLSEKNDILFDWNFNDACSWCPIDDK